MRLGISVLLSLVVAGSAAAQDLTPYTLEARAAIQRLRGVMMEQLQKTMKEVGPAGATQVCRHLAPEIASEIARETGWELRRTGVRVRNPANRPTAQEQELLRGYVVRAAAGQSMVLMETVRTVERDGKPYVHYMRAVPTFEPCLACHGAKLAPDVAAAIREFYPDDEAVGFAAGDLRGAMSLYKPYDPEKIMKAKPQAGPARSDLPSKVALGAPGRFGDAAAGYDAYQASCLACHAAPDLAKHVVVPGTGDVKPGVCKYLETHGLTDSVRDCDIVAYLKAVANWKN